MVAWYHRLALIGVMVCLFILPKVVNTIKGTEQGTICLNFLG